MATRKQFTMNEADRRRRQVSDNFKKSKVQEFNLMFALPTLSYSHPNPIHPKFTFPTLSFRLLNLLLRPLTSAAAENLCCIMLRKLSAYDFFDSNLLLLLHDENALKDYQMVDTSNASLETGASLVQEGLCVYKEWEIILALK